MKGKVEKGKGREGINWRTGASYHRGTGSVWEKIFEAQLSLYHRAGKRYVHAQ